MDGVLRVMLVDKHATFREGLRALFQSVPDVQIVHDVGDGQSAIDAVRTISPDVLVIDLSLPGGNGISVMRRLQFARRQTQIVVLTRHREAGYVREALAAGASGYVLKQSSFNELRRALDAVSRGGRYLDPALGCESSDPSVLKGETTPPTDREIAVLRRSAVGQTNRDIARDLGISVKTVEAHKAHAMRKLGLRGRRQLIRYAAFQGWLTEV